MSSDQFPGGVWLVELAPVGVGDAVPAAVAATLGVQLQPGSTMTESIVAWLRSRPTLLILDNCEHVLDHVAPLVAAIEAGAPEATVLATSREPLGLPGEVVRRVPSLDPATDAVQLFAERAATASDGFVLDDANRPVVSAICARLDGIPLAIELAAARVRALSPAEILARLDDRFRLLRSSGRGGHERHQTLLATVTWSVQLLSPEERCLFERLSVFAGSFSLADAEAVCGMDSAGPVGCGRSVVGVGRPVDGGRRSRPRRGHPLPAVGNAAPIRRTGPRGRPDGDGDDAGPAPGPLPRSGRALVRPAARPPRNRRPTERSAATGTTCAPRSIGRWPPAGAVMWPTCCTPPTAYAMHTGRWEHRDWAAAARAAGADTGRIASATVVVWCSPAQSDVPPDALAALDPTQPDLLARDIERIWLARAATAFVTNDPDEIERATAWLHEQEPGCGEPITEAWTLANLIDATLSAPDPALVARLHRLGQTSPSPSVQAIAGFVLHGVRYLNPKLGDGLDLGDIVDGLQHATECSQVAGNLMVEAICMSLAMMPLTDRGKRTRCRRAARHARPDPRDPLRPRRSPTWRPWWPFGSCASGGPKLPASPTDGSALM